MLQSMPLLVSIPVGDFGEVDMVFVAGVWNHDHLLQVRKAYGTDTRTRTRVFLSATHSVSRLV